MISDRGPSTPPFTRFAVAAGVVIWAAFAACLGTACGSNAQTTAADASTNHSDASDGSVTPDATVVAMSDASVVDAADVSDGETLDGCHYLDAEVPSAQSDGACGLRLVSCSAGCGFTPTDVACDSSSECRTFTVPGHCGCGGQVVGVNTTSTGSIVRCPLTYCPPPPSGTLCPLLTEHCEAIYDASNVAVACVDHQCVTYATAVGGDGDASCPTGYTCSLMPNGGAMVCNAGGFAIHMHYDRRLLSASRVLVHGGRARLVLHQALLSPVGAEVERVTAARPAFATVVGPAPTFGASVIS